MHAAKRASFDPRLDPQSLSLLSLGWQSPSRSSSGGRFSNVRITEPLAKADGYVHLFVAVSEGLKSRHQKRW